MLDAETSPGPIVHGPVVDETVVQPSLGPIVDETVVQPSSGSIVDETVVALDCHEMKLPFPDTPQDGPISKKPKLDISHVGRQSVLPPETFRVKWIQNAAKDLVPYVLNTDTNVVHCGLAQMQVFHFGPVPIVHCLRGCHYSCPGDTPEHCGCHCHLLQWHYQRRAKD